MVGPPGCSDPLICRSQEYGYLGWRVASRNRVSTQYLECVFSPDSERELFWCSCFKLRCLCVLWSLGAGAAAGCCCQMCVRVRQRSGATAGCRCQMRALVPLSDVWPRALWSLGAGAAAVCQMCGGVRLGSSTEIAPCQPQLSCSFIHLQDCGSGVSRATLSLDTARSGILAGKGAARPLQGVAPQRLVGQDARWKPQGLLRFCEGCCAREAHISRCPIGPMAPILD